MRRLSVVRSAPFKLVNILGLALFFAQLGGLFEALHAYQHNYSYCFHTKQKIEKHKPCPCGCKKGLKTRPAAKFVSADQTCSEDSEEALTPVFARWIFIQGNNLVLAQKQQTVSYAEILPYLQSVTIESESPPPRA